MSWVKPIPAPGADDQTEALRLADALLLAGRFAEARGHLRRLAEASPGVTYYRALLALARGHEASEAGDHQRARAEWRRALILDPTLDRARVALRRSRAPSFLGRIVDRFRSPA